jgi:hypothetical protein
VGNLKHRLLIAAGAITFFAAFVFLGRSRRLRRFEAPKSNKKCFQQKGFFAARAFALQIGQNHGLGKFAPCCATPTPRFSKNSRCPSRRTAHHVLPAFARSCSADVMNKSFNLLIR